MSYGRGKRETLGRVDALTPVQARELAKGVLGDLAHGRDPQAERRKRKAGTIKAFLESQYKPWARGEPEDRRPDRHPGAEGFPGVDPERRARPSSPGFRSSSGARSAGETASGDTTINRDLDALRAVLSKAVEWG